MITTSDPRVTYIDLQWPTVTYSDPKVTHIDPTHLLLPLPTSPGPYWAVSWRFREVRVEGRKEGGGNQI